jgi:hypothetical protein
MIKTHKSQKKELEDMLETVKAEEHKKLDDSHNEH